MAKKWENLTQEDFLQLSTKELKSYLKQAASVANARIQYAKTVHQKSGLDYSPAVRAWKESGGVRFGRTRGKDLNQLRREFVRTKTFLESKTSKMMEWRQTIERTQNALKASGIQTGSAGDLSKLWNAYEKLKKLDPAVAAKELKYNVLEEITQEIDADPEKSTDEIASEVFERLTEIYEENQRLQDEYDLSELFEFGEENL